MWIYIVRSDFGGKTHNLAAFEKEEDAREWMAGVKSDLVETLNASNILIDKVEMIDLWAK